MKPPDERHFSEEELLMHLLEEDAPGLADAVAAHLSKCGHCSAVFHEYSQLQREILSWRIPELPDTAWERQKTQLLDILRGERTRTEGFLAAASHLVREAWGYALENPLPTLGYVIVVVAFASERTISLFRLDRLLPGTNEVFAILRQVL